MDRFDQILFKGEFYWIFNFNGIPTSIVRGRSIFVKQRYCRHWNNEMPMFNDSEYEQLCAIYCVCAREINDDKKNP
jgi:hypothetical protein